MPLEIFAADTAFWTCAVTSKSCVRRSVFIVSVSILVLCSQILILARFIPDPCLSMVRVILRPRLSLPKLACPSYLERAQAGFSTEHGLMDRDVTTEGKRIGCFS